MHLEETEMGCLVVVFFCYFVIFSLSLRPSLFLFISPPPSLPSEWWRTKESERDAKKESCWQKMSGHRRTQHFSPWVPSLYCTTNGSKQDAQLCTAKGGGVSFAPSRFGHMATWAYNMSPPSALVREWVSEGVFSPLLSASPLPRGGDDTS